MQKLPKITISEDQLEQGSIELMKYIRPNWDVTRIKFKLFTEGFTNRIIGCWLDGHRDDLILVRVYGKGSELMIDRQAEINIMVHLNEAGLAPPIYCSFANGIAYGFVPGCDLDENLVRKPKVYHLVSDLMAKYHNIKIDSNPESIMFKMIKKLISHIPDTFNDELMNKRYKDKYISKEKLNEELSVMEKYLTKLDSPVVFCHNDILLKNIIYNESKNEAHFIDFEYAGPNFQAYDIANHFCEFSDMGDYKPELYPDVEFQKKWIRSYLTTWHKLKNMAEVTDDDVDRLQHIVDIFSVMPNFMWSVWAIIQAENSSIDFDYLGRLQHRQDNESTTIFRSEASASNISSTTHGTTRISGATNISAATWTIVPRTACSGDNMYECCSVKFGEYSREHDLLKMWIQHHNRIETCTRTLCLFCMRGSCASWLLVRMLPDTILCRRLSRY